MLEKLSNLTGRATAEVLKSQPHVASNAQFAFEHDVFASNADLSDGLNCVHTEVVAMRKDMIELKVSIDRLRAERLG